LSNLNIEKQIVSTVVRYFFIKKEDYNFPSVVRFVSKKKLLYVGTSDGSYTFFLFNGHTYRFVGRDNSYVTLIWSLNLSRKF
jgi:hypothetical protein